jgi:hypothetical protein
LNVRLETFPFEVGADENNPFGVVNCYFVANVRPGVFHNPPFAVLVVESVVDVALWKLHVDLLVHVGVEGGLVAVHEEVH